MAEITAPGVMTTADGTPLKVSLNRALRRNKLRAFFWVLPLLTFLVISFLIPIGSMMFRSVQNDIVSQVFHRTVPLLQKWDETTGELPDEEVFAAFREDILEGRENRTIGKAARRLNFERSGMSSAFRSAPRKLKTVTVPPFKQQIIDINKKAFGNVNTWRLIKRESRLYTSTHFFASIDMRLDDLGTPRMRPKNERIYVKIFIRTLILSGVITGLCLLLGFPIAYLLATLPTKTSNLLLILVLLPFWTSLLVRTTSWIAILQQQGVLNDLLVWVGFLSDESRIRMIHNMAGTIIAMTHILLPFMILPLFSVMKTIPAAYMRAALSMGANPVLAFRKIYFPQTVPGIGAGCILVFIIAIGYYITPELVGGTSGTLISNFIANYMSSNALNWSLAAALGVILLGIVLVLYLLYDKVIGIDNMKLG